MGQRKIRSVVVILCAVASFAVTLGGISAGLEAAGVESGSVGIGFGMILEVRAERLAVTRILSNERIIVLGDSTVVDYPAGQSVPDHLRRLLNTGGTKRFEVIPLAEAGMASPEYYAFADRIAEMRPDQIVVPINLASLSESWRHSEFNRIESVGWLHLYRLPDLLTRPFHAWNLTLDRILLYMGIVGLDLTDEWRLYGMEQVRALHGIGLVRAALTQSDMFTLSDGLPFLGLPFHPEIENRPTRRYVEEFYGVALEGAEADQFAIQMLEGALEIFQRAGIPVLAYAIPMDVEHFEKVGLDTRTGTRKTIQLLRSVVEDRGGTFIDLHRLFPDMAFKDLGGHFHQDEDFDGAYLLAKELVPELLRHRPRPVHVRGPQTD